MNVLTGCELVAPVALRELVGGFWYSLVRHAWYTAVVQSMDLTMQSLKNERKKKEPEGEKLARYMQFGGMCLSKGQSRTLPSTTGTRKNRGVATPHWRVGADDKHHTASGWPRASPGAGQTGNNNDNRHQGQYSQLLADTPWSSKKGRSGCPDAAIRTSPPYFGFEVAALNALNRGWMRCRRVQRWLISLTRSKNWEAETPRRSVGQLALIMTMDIIDIRPVVGWRGASRRLIIRED